MKNVARAARRRYGLTSRRVAVRTHVAWYWRGLFMVAALCCGIGLAWWMSDIGGLFSGVNRGYADQQLMRMRDRIKQLETENERLRTLQISNDRHSQIDNAAQLDTERALKGLQDENAQLKEKLAIFHGINSAGHVAGVNVYRFKVEPLGGELFRYQLLLFQAGQRDKVFQGRLQLVVTARVGTKNSVLIFPESPAQKNKYILTVKSYQELEGSFQLPSDSVLVSVEARIFSAGANQPILTKLVKLS